MKRLFILFAVCVLLSMALSACSSGDTKPTEDGVLTEVFDDNGSLTGYERRYHNDNGDITRLDVYDAEQVYQSFDIYEYDDSGRLSAETHYQADGIAVSRKAYTYDGSGKLFEIAHESPHGDAVVYRYDVSETVNEVFYYDTEGKLERHEVLEDGSWTSYDADGNKLPTENE